MLWEKWKDRKAGAELLTFTVITTDPNAVVQPLHDRMPVIIPEKDYERWLRLVIPERPPVDLLRPFDADKMTAWKVDKAVGNVKNDRPELIEPASAAPSRRRIAPQKLQVRSSMNPSSDPRPLEIRLDTDLHLSWAIGCVGNGSETRIVYGRVGRSKNRVVESVLGFEAEFELCSRA
jgi:hypothetical protein